MGTSCVTSQPKQLNADAGEYEQQDLIIEYLHVLDSDTANTSPSSENLHLCNKCLFPVTRRSPSNPKMGLLLAILSVIFMKGGVVRESEFQSALNKIKASSSVERHKFDTFVFPRRTDLIWNTLKKLRVDPG